jgi:hypothetical protein
MEREQRRTARAQSKEAEEKARQDSMSQALPVAVSTSVLPDYIASSVTWTYCDGHGPSLWWRGWTARFPRW